MTAPLPDRLLAEANLAVVPPRTAEILREAHAALSGREAVATVTYSDGMRTIVNVEREGLPAGTKLYTTPQPSDGWVLVPVAKLREILILLDNVTAATDSEADYLGQAENMLDRLAAAPSAKGV